MSEPKEQQIEPCLLEFNWEEIENDLIEQCNLLPYMDPDTERMHRQTMTEAHVLRSVKMERERLELENVKLTAKREQQMHQINEIAQSIERARDDRADIIEKLEQEQRDTELRVTQYEDTLEVIAERFRSTRVLVYCSEAEIKAKLEKMNVYIVELEEKLKRKQGIVDELKLELQNVQPSVPEDLLATITQYFEKTVKNLTEREKSLMEKLDFHRGKSSGDGQSKQ